MPAVTDDSKLVCCLRKGICGLRMPLKQEENFNPTKVYWGSQLH